MAAGANLAGGGIGQAAGDLLREMKKAQADVQQMTRQNASDAGKFQSAMQDQASRQSQQTSATQTQGSQAGSQELGNKTQREERIKSRLATTKVGASERAAESKLASMLESLVHGQDKMTKIMNLALSGHQFGPSELLAMQAGVYRFTQELDLTSKVVEKATGGIKQTLNTQI